MGNVATDVKTPPPEWHFDANGLGTMRSAGSMIVLLLSLEDEGNRAAILVDAAKQMGISLTEMTDEYMDEPCKSCGMSLVLHKQTNGLCP